MLAIEQLIEIKARCAAATPGPWEATHRHTCLTNANDESGGLGLDVDGPPEASCRGQFARGADAAFIAHAREDVPALLAALAESEAKVARLQAIVTGRTE